MAEDRWPRVLSLGPTELNHRGAERTENERGGRQFQVDWERGCTAEADTRGKSSQAGLGRPAIYI